jgi:hypothetical protein
VICPLVDSETGRRNAYCIVSRYHSSCSLCGEAKFYERCGGVVRSAIGGGREECDVHDLRVVRHEVVRGNLLGVGVLCV